MSDTPTDIPPEKDFIAQQRLVQVTQDRITVNEMIYHQVLNDQPTSYSMSFERLLPVSSEQVYDRRLTVGEEWKKIDFGWLTEPGVGLFLIQNLQGKFPFVIPTAEERAAEMSKSIELGVKYSVETPLVQSCGILILPNESSRLTPREGVEFYLKSLSGSSKYRLIAFPK